MCSRLGRRSFYHIAPHPGPQLPSAINETPPPPSHVFGRIPLVCTADVDEARKVFREVYADAILEPEGAGAFRWTLDLIPCGPLQITLGQLSGATRVVAPAGSERYVLTMSGAGMCAGEHAGQAYGVVPGRSGMVFSTGLPLTLRAKEGFQGRNITIEPGALETHLKALTGQAPRGPIVFEAAVDFQTHPGSTLLGIAQLLEHEVEQPGASPLLLAALRDAFLTSLLTGMKHSASHLLEPAPARVGPGSVRRAAEYIEAHAAEPITLADIAAATGVPARSLRAAFTARHGMAPMKFLQQRRFELARQRLIDAAPGTTVASVVKALGIGDAGRFSVAFKRRFGQSPSEVLAGGRGAPASLVALRGRGG